MENSNTRIWSQLEKTPTTAAKKNEFNGQFISTISTGYFQQKITEVFGPFGEGWGYTILNERFISGAPYTLDGSLFHEQILVLYVRVWVIDPETKKKLFARHYGSKPFVIKTKYGPKTDTDAPAKAVTSAMKKAFTLFGFAADIYAGLFDDEDYLQESRNQEAAKTEEEKAQASIKAEESTRNWLKKELETYPLISNPAALKRTYNNHHDSVVRRCQAASIQSTQFLKTLSSAYERRMDQIAPVADLVCPSCGSTGNGRIASKCPDCGTPRVELNDEADNN
ncbi:MAG: hypothetical protein K6L60_05455 [Oceanobacter sp.]